MGSVTVADFSGQSKDIGTRLIGGVHFQSNTPAITTFHYVTDGTDSVNVVASAAYLRAVRVFNTAAYAVFVKLHNTATAPTAGTGVVWAVGVQSGLSNPDPLLSGGGRLFSSGIGMSVVQEAADAGTTAVSSGVLIEIEYEQYT